MVKFTFAPLALLALAATAMAQESSSSSATSSASTASPTSMSSASSSASAGAGQSGVCAVLVGDPRYPPHGCPYSSTSTPPYDLNSLMSYLIGGYTAKKEGVHITDVADDLAGSVTKYYPTMTTPKSVIAQVRKSYLGRITPIPHTVPFDILLRCSRLLCVPCCESGSDPTLHPPPCLSFSRTALP
ncbi:hypothetical protein IE53DRAFT_385731 [Violaceomyces palustris]|uniref:Uncharacterized protein n=1 Tax=Violaceomyces palustris TaxID=1673888 RepID=A0ACD0P1F4_9BASI|nr:hypothetical protein IE53DRAFT_385731 [Violaceomyces palustris]